MQLLVLLVWIAWVQYFPNFPRQDSGPFWDICLAIRLSVWWSSRLDCKQLLFRGQCWTVVYCPLNGIFQSPQLRLVPRVYACETLIFEQAREFLKWFECGSPEFSFFIEWFTAQGEIGTAFYIIASGQVAGWLGLGWVSEALDYFARRNNRQVQVSIDGKPVRTLARRWLWTLTLHSWKLHMLFLLHLETPFDSPTKANFHM